MIYFCAVIRYVSAILLLIAFAAQTFNGAFIQLGYYMNPGSYAKNCINKSRPKLHCNGKCQLMKKMQEEEKKEQESLERKWEIKVTVLAPRPVAYKAVFNDIPADSAPLAAPDFYKEEIILSVFHPPQNC
ncbi:MAG: hypothetical protein U0V75_03965 [Ferruginibacter sp.]